MSPAGTCPAEWELGAYVDDGLAPAERRALDAHLVGCERCRRRVVALGAEARVLARALQEPASTAEASSLAAPTQGVATGFPVALGVAVLLFGAAGFLVDFLLPSGASWLRPSRLVGVNEMIVDVLFMLRQRGSGWLEFAMAMGVLTGCAALATFAASALTRRFSRSTALVLLPLALLALAPSPAQARLDVRSQQDVRIPAGERVEGTLVATGESLVVEGEVEGDVLAFSERVAIRGRVTGVVFAAGREVEVSGAVADLVAAGEEVRLGGSVAGNAYLAGDRVSVEPDARIGRDLVAAGERLVVEGDVGRDATTFAERLRLAGRMGRDLTSYGERVALESGARVGRDLSAHVPSAEALEISPQASVVGETVTKLERGHPHGPFARYRQAHFYAWLLIGFVASFLVGVGLYALVPGLFRVELATGRSFLLSVGRGAVVLLLAPVAIVLLAITVVGLPAALIAAALFAIGLYLGGILVASVIGRALTRPRGEGLREFGLALLAGLAVLLVLKLVPFVGGAARLVVLLAGLGLLAERLQGAWQGRHRLI